MGSYKRALYITGAGLAMMAAGFLWFERAPDGTSPATTAPFGLIVVGLIVMLVGMWLQQKAKVRDNWAELLDPASEWRRVGEQSFETARPSGPVRLRFIDAQYSHGREVAPRRTELKVGFANPVGVTLEIRESTSFFETDVRDVFSGLKPVEVVQFGRLHVLGHPLEQAATLAQQLSSRGFEAWRDWARQTAKLNLVRGRLSGDTFELLFDGWADEFSAADAGQGLPAVLDRLVKGPLSWS